MPLPAYMLQQTAANPVEALTRRIVAKGVTVGIRRMGTTLLIRNMDADDVDTASSALRMIAQFADIQGLVVDAHVPTILAHLNSAYVANGFLIGYDAKTDDEDGSHHVMRRKPR